MPIKSFIRIHIHSLARSLTLTEQPKPTKQKVKKICMCSNATLGSKTKNRRNWKRSYGNIIGIRQTITKSRNMFSNIKFAIVPNKWPCKSHTLKCIVGTFKHLTSALTGIWCLLDKIQMIIIFFFVGYYAHLNRIRWLGGFVCTTRASNVWFCFGIITIAHTDCYKLSKSGWFVRSFIWFCSCQVCVQ